MTDKKALPVRDVTSPNVKMLKLSVTPTGALPALPLPDTVTEDYINCKSTVGLSFHVLEAGFNQTRPLLLLLHEFGGLAYSWRKIMPALASADYYVVAVDQRGYGRTTGWESSSYETTDLDKFSMRQYAADMVALVYGLGFKSVDCIIGHGFGATVASMCALMRPDFFKSCILISTPFSGIDGLTVDQQDKANHGPGSSAQSARLRAQSVGVQSNTLAEDRDIHFALAQLAPPRKHYRWYNSFATSASDYRYPPQGLGSFLRGFYHLQSSEYIRRIGRPTSIDSWVASELSKLPDYYIMPLNKSMPEVVAASMEAEENEPSMLWLPDEELAVYVEEYSRTGFQGALNYFRVDTDPEKSKQLMYLAGARIEVPVAFVCGEHDWGSFEDPGVVQIMPKFCKDFRGVKIIPNAGHWSQQEQPGALTAEILTFLWNVDSPRRSPRLVSARNSPRMAFGAPSAERLPITTQPQGSGTGPSVSNRTIPVAAQNRTAGGQIERGDLQSADRPISEHGSWLGQAQVVNSMSGGVSEDANREKSNLLRTSQPNRTGFQDAQHERERFNRRASFQISSSARRRPNDPDTPHPDAPLDTDFPPRPTQMEFLQPTTSRHAGETRHAQPILTLERPSDVNSNTYPGPNTSTARLTSASLLSSSTLTPSQPISHPSTSISVDGASESASDVHASDASERNAQIYKQVSEQARRRLEDAEKQFRRMGKDVKTRDYSELAGTHGSYRNEHSDNGEVKQRGTRLAPSERRPTPFETDMVVGPPTPGMRP